MDIRFVPIALLLPLLACLPCRAGNIVVTPAEDTNAILRNPDMGWVVYDSFPMDNLPATNEFPEADAAGIMFSWRDVEPREGVYDFSKVDAACDHWRQRGKSIQLRMSADSLIWRPPAGEGPPGYVVDRLSPAEKQTRQMGRIRYVVLDARNSFYRARLKSFLRAVARHFDQRRPVSLIDLRGFGAWGEWHSGFRYPNLEARRAGLKDILDTWSESLPRETLALSFSYDPDGPAEYYAGPYDKLDPAFTTNYGAFLRFSAFDVALAKPSITFRRDGCGGAVHSNERKLNDEAFRVYHRAPMFSEFLGGYTGMMKAGSNWVTWAVEDALSLHPNYINLIGWQGPDARKFADERPDLIARGLREMGYRLVPTRIEYPQEITDGVKFKIEADWVNRGVGRPLRDYRIEYRLLDTSGATVAKSVPVILQTSQWLKGSTFTVGNDVRFKNAPPGDYQLAFVLRDPLSGRAVALPLSNGNPNGEYRIGRIKVRQ